MELKTIVGVIAVGLNMIAFWPYIVDTLRRKTKPHMYSWLVWTLITGIVFVGQLADGAGAGAWSTGITTVINLVIFLLSLKYGTSDITLSDKICLGSAGAVLLFWALSNSMTLSIIMVTIVDVLAFVPTIRKSYKKPKEETFITYPLSTVRCTLGVLAIANYSVITCLYPVAMFAMYGIVTAVLLFRQPANMHKLQWRSLKRHYASYFQLQQSQFETRVVDE